VAILQSSNSWIGEITKKLQSNRTHIIGRWVKLLLAQAKIVILGFESRRDPWPRFLFSPRHGRVLQVGSLLE
jgi:hypothetical protein